MANERSRPALSPALQLLSEPTPEDVTGRGKSEKTTKTERVEAQRQSLRAEVNALAKGRDVEIVHGNDRVLLKATMFSDSLAPTHTPFDLLPIALDCRFVAPTFDGYIIDVDRCRLPAIARHIATATRWGVLSDISRVRSVSAYTQWEALRGRDEKKLWSRAVAGERGRFFVVWLRPYADASAREEVMRQFEGYATERVLLPVLDEQRSGQVASIAADSANALAATTVGRAFREYRRTEGVGRALIQIESREKLHTLIASGTVYRIDPARPINVSAMPAPGPILPAPTLPERPVVAVVDGGFDDTTYGEHEVWRESPLVADDLADRTHGNAVSSLVANARGLNPNLDLHDYGCKFGTLQVVPRSRAGSVVLDDDLIDALANMSLRHRDVRVWNLSFNYPEPDEDDCVSGLGHEIAAIARSSNCLPIISAGNAAGSANQLLPPGDSEAALTIGGRQSTRSGKVGNPCAACCTGPGPQGMLKPELSGHSSLCVAGGTTMIGTSFPSAHYSALAAHAFENLRNPSPDLVKALLINKADRNTHHAAMGWGTPSTDAAPWECPEGSVTLMWTGDLEPSNEYYWNDIPIPDDMLVDGKIVGEAALTAVLRPLVSPYGTANYFASRVEVALQHQVRRRSVDEPDGRWSNLLGTMKESTLREMDARSELKKWNPIRHHQGTFPKGRTSVSDVLRVRARVYTRDLFQATLPNRGSVPPLKVSMVLTFKSPEGGAGTYNSMVRGLGNFVESAVLSQSIEVDSSSS